MDSLRNTNLMNSKGQLFKAPEILEHKSIVAYYFSASWCGPCKLLLPQLIKVYQEGQKRKSGLEVIYVSSDSDETAFKEYFMKKHGNWYSIPFEDPIGEELRLKYNVTNIPSIIVVKKDGTLISNRGRKDIEEIGLNVLVTWTE